MRIFYYQDVPNFGDVLNKYIWPHYFGPLLERNDNILLYGIGTLIGFKSDFKGQIIIFGSGAGYVDDTSEVKTDNHLISFVRGPQTAERLGLSKEAAITDPAILTPEVFPQSKKRDEVVFVPHWETSFNPLWKSLCEKESIKYVDPLSDIKQIISDISGAKLVIAEAMHAAILADAYRVPWLPVSTSPRINEYKWKDWAESLKIDLPAFHYLPSVGVSDFLRRMLHEAAGAYSKSRNTADAKKTFFQKTYAKLFSYKFHCRLEHRLMTKTGPSIDKFINRLAAAGFCSKNMSKVRADLSSMVGQPGTLSDISVASEKKMQIHTKINELVDALNRQDLPKTAN